jgi:hypothetical protein
MRRLQFIPFWNLTKYYWIRFNHQLTCDEYHNKGEFIIIPLIGQIIYYYSDYNVNQPEHLWGISGNNGNVQYEGKIFPDCSICQELLREQW